MSTSPATPNLSIKKCVFYSIGLMVVIPLILFLVNQYADPIASSSDYLLPLLVGNVLGILAIPVGLLIPIMFALSKMTVGSVIIGVFTLLACISKKKKAKIQHVKKFAPHSDGFGEKDLIILEKHSKSWIKKHKKNKSFRNFINLYLVTVIISGVSYGLCNILIPEYTHSDITTLATLISDFYQPLLLSLDSMIFGDIAPFNLLSNTHYIAFSMLLFLLLPLLIEYTTYSIDVLNAEPTDFIKHEYQKDPLFYANI